MRENRLLEGLPGFGGQGRAFLPFTDPPFVLRALFINPVQALPAPYCTHSTHTKYMTLILIKSHNSGHQAPPTSLETTWDCGELEAPGGEKTHSP